MIFGLTDLQDEHGYVWAKSGELAKKFFISHRAHRAHEVLISKAGRILGLMLSK